MKPATKLDILICHPSYGGNGGIDSEHPDIRKWEVETMLKIAEERNKGRIGEVYERTIGDTPVTMVRNRFFTIAKELGCHLVLSIDSDQSPIKHAKERGYVPFWDAAFNFIYENYHKGPRMVVAPYVGPQENIYVFGWRQPQNDSEEFSLEQFTRTEASLMSGIQEVAAGPTGLFLMDTRLLDVIEPSRLSKDEILERLYDHRMTVDEARWALREGYCYYEWTNQYADQKASTEDVTMTRDISLAGLETLGYNPLFCAWDSWIGHWKPRNCGKPQFFSTESVGASLRKAVLDNRRSNEAIVDLNLDIGMEPKVNLSKYNGRFKSNGTTTLTGRETTGPWYDHGHAPPEQCAALADLVRSKGYEQNGPIKILEVGTWLGTTAMAMADASKHATVHCVDTWEGTPTDCTGKMAELAGGTTAVYAEFIRRIGDRNNKSIFPWMKSSLEAASMDWPGGFDIIFIDAEHTYEHCLEDIKSWWPHLKDDGIMVGHDFHVHGYAGVVKAVEECFGEKHKAFGFHPQGCMWMVYKKDHLANPKLSEEIADVEAMSPVP